jgi:Tfp pilus assembly protein PilW
MSARTAPTERNRADERGFTILEVVVTTLLLTLVTVVLFQNLWNVQRSEAYTRGRTAAMDNMRVSLNRMSKDLRQATSINVPPTASHLDVDTYIDGTRTRVAYDVTGGVITRKVGAGDPVVMHTELTNDAIFTYTPAASASPDTVKIELVVKPSNLPGTTLTLNSEVKFRNR